MNINNIGFSLPSLLFIITILIIFLLNKKVKEKDDYIFLIIMIIITIIGILEVCIPYSIMHIQNYETITYIICKTFLCLIACWQVLFMFYFDINIFQNDKFKDNKIFRILNYILSIIIAIIFICIYIFTDLEFVLDQTNNIYALTGNIVKYMYANVIISTLHILIYMCINKKRLKNIYLKPIIMIMIFYVLILIIQLVYKIEINEVTFLGSMLAAVIYFTIESHDYKLMDEYKKSKEKAEKEDKAKTSFLINMSHEIRQPLNTIVGYAQLIRDEKEFKKENYKKDLKNIIYSSESLTRLINNILEITKIENDSLTINEKKYEIENIIYEINNNIPELIRNDELKFSIKVDEKIPKEYYGDSYKIYKIIYNILLNAIDNTTYGEVKLEVGGIKTEDNYFEQYYTISNSGHSMKHESFDNNFEEFVMIQGDGEDKLNSIKLGLIIAKELTKKLGGEIEFINKKGFGTKYTIKLKQKIENETPIGNTFENISNEKENKRLLDLSDKVALVVDDGEINLVMAKKSLEKYNLNVVTAKGGKECIEIVQKQKIDVIFLDHMMPEMDGIATIKALNSMEIEVPPIVALTANNYDALKTEYIAQGFYDYLQKPIVPKELNRVLKRIFMPEDE